MKRGPEVVVLQAHLSQAKQGRRSHNGLQSLALQDFCSQFDVAYRNCGCATLSLMHFNTLGDPLPTSVQTILWPSFGFMVKKVAFSK